jgi:subfamily B ATP-binding cassette protein HlyB/CyaB
MMAQTPIATPDSGNPAANAAASVVWTRNRSGYVRRLLALLGVRWRSWLGVLAGSLVLNLCGLAAPRVTQITLDHVLPSGDLRLLASLFGLMVVLAGVQVSLTVWRRLTLVRLSLEVDQRVLAEMCGHLLTLPVSFFKGRRPGDLLARFHDHGHIRHLLAGALSRVLIDTVMVFIFIGVLFTYSGWLAGLVLLWAALFAGCSLSVGPLLKRRQQRMLEDNARQEAHLVEALVGIDLVKALAVEGEVRQRWQAAQEIAIRSNYQAQKWRQILESGGTAIHLLCAASLLGCGAFLVIRGKLSAGELVAFSMYAAAALTPLFSLLTLWGEIQQARAALERVQEVIEQEPDTNPAVQPTATLGPIQGRVEVEQVSFHYPEGGHDSVLRGVTFEIRPGECVVVLGKNGSGKSTLVRLLLGLYAPSQGQVRIDGYDLAQVERASYRRQLGVVLQENLLVCGTVLDNIALGDPQPNLERAVRASQLVGAHELIEGLPRAYETAVGEMGLCLSGGQRQWVALARALYREPRLLLLDEPTSALDQVSALRLERLLPGIAAGRTTILITHSISLARLADRILVLEEGVLVEQGRPADLLGRPGVHPALALKGEVG